MRRLATTLATVLFALGFPAVLADEGHKRATSAKQAISKQLHPWGRQGDPRKAVGTIEIDMADSMRFTPAEVKVKQGDTIRFVARNSGKVMHEMVIGTEEALRRHAEMMKKHPGMEHEEPYMVHVKPGGKEDITWTFSKPGTFMYACLIPGHWDAGMKGTIVVVGANGADAQKSMTRAEVRKVDKDARKITLRHEEIENLGMPPMTMVFVVKDPAMLESLKQGDKVRFHAEKVGGALTVTHIEAVK